MTRMKKVIISSLSVLMIITGVILEGKFFAQASHTTDETNKQVTMSYYTDIPSYSGGTASSLGTKTTYTTKSLGRIQWSEADSDGNYAVYYDAGDIHQLAEGVNTLTSEFETLYSTYQATINSTK